MPYKLRKAPNRDAYWVVNKETGRRLSKDPLPKESARAQMRAVYRAERMKGKGTEELIRAEREARFGPRKTTFTPEEKQAAIVSAARGRMKEDLRRLEAQQTFQDTTRADVERDLAARREAYQPSTFNKAVEGILRVGDVAKQVADLPGMELNPAFKLASSLYGVTRKFLDPDELARQEQQKAEKLQRLEERQAKGKEYEARAMGDIAALKQRLGGGMREVRLARRNARLGCYEGGKLCGCGPYFGERKQ